MKVKQQQLELYMEEQTGSKLGKEYVKAVYCHPAYLTYIQSTSWETVDWKKHKLESRFPGNINNLSGFPSHHFTANTRGNSEHSYSFCVAEFY